MPLTLDSRSLRTSEVAEAIGYSVQQIRNLEHDGALPPAARTTSGYRCYEQRHIRSALAYRELAVALGPVAAKRLLRVVHDGPTVAALAAVDAAHAELDHERTLVRLARDAAESIRAEPLDEGRPADAMTVSELADALGVRASTLRHWDAEGLVVPARVPPRDARRYDPAHVRDARIVHQLRAAGYRVPALRSVLPELRRDSARVAGALADRDSALAARSRALLSACASLDELIAR